MQKSYWTEEEDKLLNQLCANKKYSERWGLISRVFIKFGFNRKSKQCKERWRNNFQNQNTNRDWSSEELKRLVKLFTDKGTKWKLISSYFPQKSYLSVKNKMVSFIKVILKQVNLLFKHSFHPNEINLIRTSVIDALIPLSFKFVLKDGREIFLSLRNVFLSYFNNFSSLLIDLDKDVREDIIREFLETIIVISKQARCRKRLQL